MSPFLGFGKGKEQQPQSAHKEMTPPTLDQLKAVYNLGPESEVVDCRVVQPYKSKLGSLVGPGTPGYARTVSEMKEALEEELKQKYINDGIEVRVEAECLGIDPKTNKPVSSENAALVAVKKG